MQDKPINERKLLLIQMFKTIINEEVFQEGKEKILSLLPILFIGIGILLGGFLGLKSSFMFNTPKTLETAQNK